MVRTRARRCVAALAAIPFATIVVAIAASCRGDVVSPLPMVTTVRVSGVPAEGVVIVGDTLTLSASTTDASGQTRLDGQVAWSSSNASVATVSARGLVAGVSAGTAIIRASSGATSDSAPLSVRVAVVPPSPNSTGPMMVQSVLGGRVTLSIPPSAVPAGVTRLTVGPASAPPASSELVAGTAFDFGPSGTRFTTPLQLTLAFDPNSVPASARAGLAIYHVVGGDYEEVLNSVVDNVFNTVSAPISGFSSFAILRRAAPASVNLRDGDGQSSGAGTAVQVRPAVRVLDTRARPVAFVAVDFAVASGGGSIAGGAQFTDRDGIATVGSWRLGLSNGANTLTATVTGLPPVTFTASGIVGAPALLVVNAQPVSTTAGTSLPAIVVSVVDANNAPTPSFTGPVTITLGANPGAATLGGTTTVTAVGGVATFSNLTINRSGAGYRLVASAPGLTSATSTAFDIVAGPARHLEFGRYPLTGATAFIAIDSITVLARDVAGNLATTFTGSVVLGLFSAPFGATLQGVATIGAVGGVATFRSMRFEVAGRYQLQALSSGLPALVGEEFTIRELPPTTPRLTVVSGGSQTAPPGTTLPLPIVVEVLGADGHPAVGQTVNFAIATGGGQISPANATTNSAGRAATSWTLGSQTGVQTMTAATASIAATISAIAQSPAGSGVQVRTSTTGSDLPVALTFFVANCPSGFNDDCYSDSGPATHVAPNGTFSLNLAPGRYLFYILELPLNCAVASPQQVTVTGSPITVAFNVTCIRAGTIRVSAPTTGTDPATSYSITVDGSWAADIAAGASASIRAGEGSHSVQLTQVAPNCTVTGPNPATVNVVGGAVTDVAFPVSCTPNPTLQVTVTTTGTNIPAQYFVGVDYYYFYDYYLFGLTVPANGTASIRLPPGSHDVNLAGVAANCTVTSANSLSVTMSLGATTNVAFTVVCR